jgi:acetylornithine deacetylase/succinyl-diaminopimelate desuccinylase-like protein
MNEIELLKKLIQIPSYSGDEKKLADFIVDYCAKNNISATILEGNVIIHLKGKDRSKTVIFNAHLDTVNLGNRSKWKYSPIGKSAGKLKDGKLYGLGASDDKGALVSMLLLAKNLKNASCDVWFTFVCNEEIDGSGTLNFLKWFIKLEQFHFYKELAVIIGEPTDLKTLEIGHRGNVFAKITVHGNSGHSALKYSDRKLVVLKGMKIVELINKRLITWEKIYYDSLLGFPTINITQINTDNNFDNKLPDQCTIRMDIRTTPKFHNLIDKLLKETIGTLGVVTYAQKKVSPGFISSDHRIVALWKKIIPDVNLSISFGSTDQALFLRNGIPAVVFGPGCKKTMHKENEYIYIANIRKAASLYHKFILSFSKDVKTAI